MARIEETTKGGGSMIEIILSISMLVGLLLYSEVSTKEAKA